MEEFPGAQGLCPLTRKPSWMDGPPWPAFTTLDPLLSDAALRTAHWASILYSEPSSSWPGHRLGVEGLREQVTPGSEVNSGPRPRHTALWMESTLGQTQPSSLSVSGTGGLPAQP